MSSSTNKTTYLIVGSGVFGASTALHLVKSSGPVSQVILLDRDHFSAPRRVAASWDWNKVIRSDYASSPLSTKLALEAQRLWRTDPLFSPYYHECGSYWASHSDFRDVVDRNMKEGGMETGGKVYTVDEAKMLYKGIFKDGNYSQVNGVLVNTKSGYAQAKEALEATITEAVRLGVTYLTGEVASLEFQGDDRLRCLGVRLDDGTTIRADKVILSTGAYTAKLLMDSAPHNPEIHAGDRILAVGVTEGLSVLTPEGAKGVRMEELPIAVNDNPRGKGFEVGCQPFPKLNAFKYWGHLLFRNTIKHPLTGIAISAPPAGPDYSQNFVTPVLERDVLSAPRSIFGPGMAEYSVKEQIFRVCWDAVTPTRDFIIAPHSGADSLFIATCGSFHGFKFLPVIGKYVVEMLSGELDPALERKWAWDREVTGDDGSKNFIAEYRSFVPELQYT